MIDRINRHREESTMTLELVMPKSGMGITEGTITQWHKKEGDGIR